MRLKDHTGETSGALTVIAQAGSINGSTRWRCLCECGRTTTIYTAAIGRTKSCGFCRRLCPEGCTCAKHKTKKCPEGCTCKKHTTSRWPDHPTGGHEVGEIFSNGRELTAYSGMQNTTHVWDWKCGVCGKVNGPNGLETIKKGTYCLRGCNNGKNHHRWAGHEGFTGSFICNLQKHLIRGKRTLAWFPELTDIEIADYLWDLWVNQGGRCALSGRTIKLPQSSKSRNNASLDRIDSRIGYELGNVQWTDPAINRLKRDWPEEEFIKMCGDVIRHQLIIVAKSPPPKSRRWGLCYDSSYPA